MDPEVGGEHKQNGDSQHTLEWHVKSLRHLKGGREVLSGIAGRVSTGDFLAIFGPSGCGKTSLLECLSLRNRRFKGALQFDGKIVDSGYLLSIAVIYQAEMIFGFLTPREHLTFHAITRMSDRFRTSEIHERVEEVIQELSLQKCADTIIGGVDPIYLAKGISGGERKRLAVATELLLFPKVLFVDEPTSGLDSVLAESVVHSLKSVAESGTAVLSTIHSPSSSLARHFTHVLFLSADGRLAFQGPYETLDSYIEGMGLHVPKGFFTVDFMMEQLSRQIEEEPALLKARMDALVSHFKHSAFTIPKPLEPDSAHMSYKPVTGLRVSFLSLVQLNTWRILTMVKRDIVTYLVWTASKVMLGSLFGLLFFQSAQKTWRNMLGLLFLTAGSNLFVGGIALVFVFPAEVPIITREVLCGANTVGSYIFSKLFYIVPFCLGDAICSSIIYWMTGLERDAAAYIFFVGTMLLAHYSAVGLGMLCSSFSNNPLIGLGLSPMALFPMLTFSGIFYARSDVPWYLSWLQNLSIVNYSFSALLGSQVQGLPPQARDAIIAFAEINPAHSKLHLEGLAAAVFITFFLTYVILKTRLVLSKQSL